MGYLFFSLAGLSPALWEAASENSCLIPMETPGWKKWVPTYRQAHARRVRSYRCQAPGSTAIAQQSRKCPLGCSAHWPPPSAAGWFCPQVPPLCSRLGKQSLLPTGQWRGLSMSPFPARFEAERANPLYCECSESSLLVLRPDSSDRNEYKQDWFVRSLCLVSSLGLTGSGSGGRKWLTF